ncbi:MAG TPA: nucleotidyltransferase family protein [Solirubrobacterales bacterium]|nr:nucleotidyltransferase family protein [Solirubrobacterales bacterium]
MSGENELGELLATLKKAAAALETGHVPFLLGGGLGCWARGGPPSSKDIDLMVKREDAERALEALTSAGMRPEKPPEQWLYKAWDGDVMVDLIFEPAGIRVTDAVIERGEELNAAGMPVPVMALDDILATKLMALDEHNADYGDLLPIARALREQIDWRTLRERTSSSPFAAAFFTLADGLEIAPASFAHSEPG